MAGKSKLPPPSRPLVDCAYAPACLVPASVRRHSKNLCLDHYRAEITREGHAEWLAKGSPTAEESIAQIRKLLRNPKRRTRTDWIEHWKLLRSDPLKPLAIRRMADEAPAKLSNIPERIPGEDDEQLAA